MPQPQAAFSALKDFKRVKRRARVKAVDTKLEPALLLALAKRSVNDITKWASMI